MRSGRLVVLALLAVLAAVPLVASGGTGVPFTGQQALAVSGSFEVLVDGEREFAGATRYETSLAAARQYFYTASAAGISSDTVIVASGESLIDAAASAGLAGAVNAPVLLTTPDRLFIPVAHLIEGAGVSKVIVVGGEAVVSERVVVALRGVPGVQSVERIGGRNRFDTAALIAQRAGFKNPYCENQNSDDQNSGRRAAVLVSGDSDTLTDITVVGPLAYAMGLPILLTSAQGVPTETAAAFSDLGITHAVLVGDDPYSSAWYRLFGGLAQAGIKTITPLGGVDQFATSIQVLNILRYCLGEELSDSSVALISDAALADGISAAPMLGQGLDGDGRTTPVLLVGSETFPKVIQDYLLRGYSLGRKVYTIGGEAAVSSKVAKAAVQAASGIAYKSESLLANEYDRCRLSGQNDKELFPNNYRNSGSAGFPLPDWAPSAKGLWRVAVLFVDFPDAQAMHTTIEEGAEELSLVEEYYRKNSYGQISLELDIHNGWLRAPKSYKEYRLDEDYLSEVEELAGLQFGYSSTDYDVTMVIRPSTHFHGGNAGSRYSFTNSFALPEVRDEPHTWWSVAAHELGHNLSLTDLYPSDSSLYKLPYRNERSRKQWSHVQIGRMGLRGIFLADTNDPRFQRKSTYPLGDVYTSHIGIFTPQEMLSWSRWQLGWLREDQVACVTAPTFDELFTLSPVAAPDGTAMIVVPTSSTTGIVIEARRQLGYDAKSTREGASHANESIVTEHDNLPYEGVIAYEVAPLATYGKLPLKFWPIVNPSNPLELDSFPTLEPGSSVTGTLADGTTLRIAVEAEDGLSYIVRVTRS